MTQVKRSRLTLITLVLVFLLPIIAAKLVLDRHWYQGAATNHGTMIVPPLDIADVSTGLPAEWRLGLLVDQECPAQCQQALHIMNQIDVALGKETERVTPTVIHTSTLPPTLAQHPTITTVASSELAQRLGEIPPHSLLIIDPLGLVVLYYPTHADAQRMRMEAKNVLADLRTLLKLSKVG